MSWLGILVLAAATYCMKAAGPVLLAGRALPAAPARALALVPAALMAALVAVSTFADGRSLGVDARAVGLAVAVAAIARRAPFLVVVLAAATATALARAAGIT